MTWNISYRVFGNAPRGVASATRRAGLAAGALIGCLATGALGQAGAVAVDAQCNIFGYGVSTPAPGGGGGGLLAISVPLNPGTGRVLTFSNTGSAWWGSSSGSNGPDGGNFTSSTVVQPLGPISGYSAQRSGHLVGLLLEAGDPTGLPAPANMSYPDAAALTAASFAPGIRQVFFIGDGLTGTGSGDTQVFHVPDGATRLILGIADAFGFHGHAGYYADNTGGYEVNYNAVPAPATLVLLGAGGLMATRRRRCVR